MLELEKRVITALTEKFLLAYEAKDIDGIIKLFDKSASLLFYGTDLADRAEKLNQIETYFQTLFSALDSIRFRNTKPDSVELSNDGKMGVAFCEVPAEIILVKDKNRAIGVILRFVLVWKKENNIWRLRQVGTFIASSGKSARELTVP